MRTLEVAALPRMCLVAMTAVLVCVAGSSRGEGGVVEVWHYDAVSASWSLPLVNDYNGDGKREAVFATRFDGAVWIVDSAGRLLKRLPTHSRIEGSMAMAPGLALFAYEDCTGRLILSDLARGVNFWAALEGAPVVGGAPCFADLDADGSPELLCARGDGVVSAFDLRLNPLWQFDAGAALNAPPTVAPVFEKTAAVYVSAVAGGLYALTGEGRPVWQFRPDPDDPKGGARDGPLVVALGEDRPVVLLTSAQGTLYALDAVDGRLRWRVHVGVSDLGAPAVIDVRPETGPEIVVVSEQGDLGILGGDGAVLGRAKLPEGRYVARPLVADVDGDGRAEVLVANRESGITVASLDGEVEAILDLRGDALAGLVLEDIDGDGSLELFAATDCARFHCFSTQAKHGWKHPRGQSTLHGYVPPDRAGQAAHTYPVPSAGRTFRGPRQLSVSVSDFSERSPFATAFVRLRKPKAGRYVSIVVRSDEAIVGSALKRLAPDGITIPFVKAKARGFTLDLAIHDETGRPVASVADVPVRPGRIELVRLTPPESLTSALAQQAERFAVPEAWRLPEVLGQDSWFVLRFAPDLWKAYGLKDDALIANAAACIPSPLRGTEPVFGPQHPAWQEIAPATKPFFVGSDLTRQKQPYAKQIYDEIASMAGDRFLGFPVQDWSGQVWQALEGRQIEPATRKDATAALKAEFDRLRALSYDKVCAGQTEGLLHHQSLAWGAPMAYALLGDDVPCTSLRLAFLRGASRQYGGRPWGVSISNRFRGAVVDTFGRGDLPRATWLSADYVDGADCGHSASLESRLEMAAHLAGATFVHHQSDPRDASSLVQEDDPGCYSFSAFGAAAKSWYEHAQRYQERGIPYTPMAFLLDFDQGWRPGQDIFGLWPQERHDHAVEAMFRHVYGWRGPLGFERDHLTNGPYGEIFDVITDNAPLAVLQQYGVLWPLGRPAVDPPHVAAYSEYVKQGGILVVDFPLATAFPTKFLGVRFSKETSIATQVQTALGKLTRVLAPYGCQRMTVRQDAQTLAWTDSGDPLVAWRRVGSGVLIVSATQDWLDQRGHLLPIVPALLRVLADEFLPVQAPPEVQMFLNRADDGWIIGLVNNNGIRKAPATPTVKDDTGSRDCVLHFGKQVPLRFIPRLGEFRWTNFAGGLLSRLGPGEVAVVKVVFPTE